MLRQRFQLPLYPSPSPQNRLQQRFRKISFFFLNPRGHHFTSDFKNTTMVYPVSPSDLFQISGGNLRSTVIWTHCDFRQVRSNFLLLHAVGVKAFSWSWAQLPRSFSARHEADGLFEVECCPSPSPVLWQVLPMGTSAWICLSWSMSLLPSLQRSTRYHYFLNEKKLLLGYSCFTELCKVLQYNEENPLHAHMYPSLLSLPPHRRVITERRAGLPVLRGSFPAALRFHGAGCVCQCRSPSSPTPPPLCPHAHSPCLPLHSCPANTFICLIFF